MALLSLNEAAKRAGKSKRELARLIHKGTLRTVKGKCGGVTIDAADLARALAPQQAPATAAMVTPHQPATGGASHLLSVSEAARMAGVPP